MEFASLNLTQDVNLYYDKTLAGEHLKQQLYIHEFRQQPPFKESAVSSHPVAPTPQKHSQPALSSTATYSLPNVSSSALDSYMDCESAGAMQAYTQKFGFDVLHAHSNRNSFQEYLQRQAVLQSYNIRDEDITIPPYMFACRTTIDYKGHTIAACGVSNTKKKGAFQMAAFLLHHKALTIDESPSTTPSAPANPYLPPANPYLALVSPPGTPISPAELAPAPAAPVPGKVRAGDAASLVEQAERAVQLQPSVQLAQEVDEQHAADALCEPRTARKLSRSPCNAEDACSGSVCPEVDVSNAAAVLLAAIEAAAPLAPSPAAHQYSSHVPQALFPAAVRVAHMLTRAAARPTSPYSVLPVSSRAQALRVALASIAAPGDTVLVQSPAPAHVYPVLHDLRLRVVHIDSVVATATALRAAATTAHALHELTAQPLSVAVARIVEGAIATDRGALPPRVAPALQPSPRDVAALIKSHQPVAVLLFPGGAGPCCPALDQSVLLSVIAACIGKKHKPWLVCEDGTRIQQQHVQDMVSLLGGALSADEEVVQLAQELCMCRAGVSVSGVLGALHECACGKLTDSASYRALLSREYTDTLGAQRMVDDPVALLHTVIADSNVLRVPPPPTALRGIPAYAHPAPDTSGNNRLLPTSLTPTGATPSSPLPTLAAAAADTTAPPPSSAPLLGNLILYGDFDFLSPRAPAYVCAHKTVAALMAAGPAYQLAANDLLARGVSGARLLTRSLTRPASAPLPLYQHVSHVRHFAEGLHVALQQSLAYWCVATHAHGERLVPSGWRVSVSQAHVWLEWGDAQGQRDEPHPAEAFVVDYVGLGTQATLFGGAAGTIPPAVAADIASAVKTQNTRVQVRTRAPSSLFDILSSAWGVLRAHVYARDADGTLVLCPANTLQNAVLSHRKRKTMSTDDAREDKVGRDVYRRPQHHMSDDDADADICMGPRSAVAKLETVSGNPADTQTQPVNVCALSFRWQGVSFGDALLACVVLREATRGPIIELNPYQ